jgi:hypothetical protein
MYSGDEFYGDDVTSPLARPLPAQRHAPTTITANGARWTLHEQRGGLTTYRRGRAVRSFDAWQMTQIVGAGLQTEERGGKVTMWRAEHSPRPAGERRGR